MAPSASAPRNTDLEESIVEARQQYRSIRPNSEAAHLRARRFMPNGNTRSNLVYAPFPTAMASGEACFLQDIDGNRYIDLCGEYTAGLFGHSDPRIVAAVKAAIDRGLNLAAVGTREADLAEAVCARFPSIEKVRFTNSGTEANLLAFSTARAFTGRKRMMAIQGGYHGGLLTFAGGGSPINAPFDVILAPYNDIPGTLALMQEHETELAAIVLEPMVGGGGCIPADRAFLAALREEATKRGILLIFDEVMTSRHAWGGLQALLGVTPDMTTLGKYIGGGMSAGAFGGRAEIMSQFEVEKPGALPHSGTFNNNVLTMAAGLTALRDIFKPEVAESLRERGDRLRADLNEICSRQGAEMQFTGIGSMMQVHFRTEPIRAPYALTQREEALRELYFFHMMANGIYIARRGMVALSLPVGESELAQFRQAVESFCTSRKPLLGA